MGSGGGIIYTRNCTICGNEFTTNRPYQVRCGSRECVSIAKRNNAALSRERVRGREGMQDLAEIQCPFCGKSFLQKRRNVVTCGAKTCRDALRKSYRNSEWVIARKIDPNRLTPCKACGAPFLQTHPTIVTCSNPECKRTLKNRQRLAAYHASREKKARSRKECLRCRRPFVSVGGAWLCDECRKRNSEICSGSGLGAYL